MHVWLLWAAGVEINLKSSAAAHKAQDWMGKHSIAGSEVQQSVDEAGLPDYH